jgi:hypothetical protein
MKATPEQAAHLRRIGRERVGMAGYARILGSLRAGPQSSAELAERNGVSHLLILGMMRHCLRAGVVHREQWLRTQPHARMVPKWALGAEGDVSMPQYEERTRRPRRGPSALILLTTAIELLSENGLTIAELSAELCMCRESGERVIKALRQAGLVHVGSWHKPPMGTTVAEWRYGQRPDARRPPQQKQSVYFARVRGRNRQMKLMHALAGSAGQGAAP